MQAQTNLWNIFSSTIPEYGKYQQDYEKDDHKVYLNLFEFRASGTSSNTDKGTFRHGNLISRGSICCYKADHKRKLYATK